MQSRYEELLQALLNGETADIVPQSRLEAALKNCIEGCGCDGLTEPKSRSEAYLQALAEKIKSGGGGNTGGGGGIIDVTELPTENIAEDTVYRIRKTIEPAADIWVYMPAMGLGATFADYVAMMDMSMTIQYIAVEELPETMQISDAANGNYIVYILLGTVRAYFSTDGTTPTDFYSILGASVEEIETSGMAFAVESKAQVYERGAQGFYIISCLGGITDTLYALQDGVLAEYPPQYRTEIDGLKAEVKVKTASANFTDYAVLEGSADGISLVNMRAELLTEIKISSCVTHVEYLNDQFIEELEVPEGVLSLGDALQACALLKKITLPSTLTTFGAIFRGNALTTITYNGTKEQWKALSKPDIWDTDTGNYTVYCTDGTIAKDGTET